MVYLQSLTLPQSSAPTNFSSFRCRAAVAPPPPAQVASPRKHSPGSLYEVLKVKRNASVVEIKAAYRNLAKLYHPDIATSSDTGCDFIQIHNAYETLSDPAARALYDMTLGLGSDLRLSPSFRGYSSGRRRPTQRWETDQCW